jgi:polyisoprenyl-teichoic acid--peptidoglycan teichoic acid transferase
MTTRQTNRRSRSGLRLPLWGAGLVLLLLAATVIASSIWLFRTVRDLAADLDADNPQFRDVAEGAGDAGDPSGPLPADAPEEASFLSTAALQPWQGRDRVTILALGIDQRCDEEGPTRTDTIMLLTIDPVGRSAALLSLPRDLWVEIPGFAVNKINQAHFIGEIYNYPGGGPALAVETVESAMGVRIDYYLTVNFDAFVRLVDEIGGIHVDAPEDIEDDTYPDNCYGYDPFYLSAGPHDMDGQTALKYARTRATFGGDVDRAGRQQQVAMAVLDKVLRLNMIPQLLARAPELWRIFQQNVKTDLSLNEAVQLGLLLPDLPRENVQTEVIDFDYVYAETTPDGQQVLIPIRSEIRALRDELFAPPAIPTPVVENLPQLSAAENARLAVYNGTPVFGLAAATQTFLEQQSFNVVEIGNADSAEYRTTQIIDFGSHPSTTHYLVQLMGIPPLNVSSSTNPTGDYDILIILGSDWEAPGSG